MNGKIFLVLAVVASLALSSNLIGTSIADKFKDSRCRGSACQSYETMSTQLVLVSYRLLSDVW
ncbi:MAG TPA: hypothetical protein VI146_03635 [Nitrososphaeraceae archaeon]